MAIPSGYSSLGLIGFTDKGDYDADTNYVQNDLCHNGGKIWKCKLDNTIGQTPAEGTYWTVFVDPTSSVSEMEDVTLTSLADGQELTYDATANKWKNTSEISNLKQALSNEVETRGKLGAKNQFPYPYSTDSQVINGVLFTVNTDRTITVTRQSANESQAVFQLASNWISGLGDKLKGLGAFKFIGGYSNKCYINFWNNSSGSKSSESQSAATSASLPSAATIFNFSIVAATDFTGTCTIKPMILLDSETDLSYEPYAMTNKELTDVAQQEIGNYMYKGQYVASALADGTKDYETMLNEAATVMLSRLQALADDEIAFIKQVSVNSSTSPIITKIGVEFKNNATSFDIDYSKITINTSANIDVMWGRFNTTKSGVRCASESLTTGGAIPAPTDLRSTVPSSGGQFNIYYHVYKKIS